MHESNIQQVNLYPTYLEVIFDNMLKKGTMESKRLYYHQDRKILEGVRRMVSALIEDPTLDVQCALTNDETSCNRCGNCCRAFPYIPVTLAELYNIACHLGVSIEELREHATTPSDSWCEGDAVLAKTGEGCVFLKREENLGLYTCLIYPVRPHICRKYKPSDFYVCEKSTPKLTRNLKKVVLTRFYAEVNTSLTENKTLPVQILEYSAYSRLRAAVAELMEILVKIDPRDEKYDYEKPGGECKRCGYCCTYFQNVFISPEECHAIAAYLGMDPDLFMREYTYQPATWLATDRVIRKRTEDPQRNTWCVFLKREEEENLFSCTIHQVRPQGCRDYKAGDHCSPKWGLMFKQAPGSQEP